jgi:hypothetical protein
VGRPREVGLSSEGPPQSSARTLSALTAFRCRRNQAHHLASGDGRAGVPCRLVVMSLCLCIDTSLYRHVALLPRAAASSLGRHYGVELRRFEGDDKQPALPPIRHAWRVEAIHGYLGRSRRLAKSFENTTTRRSAGSRSPASPPPCATSHEVEYRYSRQTAPRPRLWETGRATRRHRVGSQERPCGRRERVNEVGQRR